MCSPSPVFSFFPQAKHCAAIYVQHHRFHRPSPCPLPRCHFSSPKPSTMPPFYVTRQEAWACGGVVLDSHGRDCSVTEDEGWQGRRPVGDGFVAPKNVVGRKCLCHQTHQWWRCRWGPCGDARGHKVAMVSEPIKVLMARSVKLELQRVLGCS